MTAIQLEVRGLAKRFGDVQAVDGIDFTARPGAVTGFLGPNGAGKTTTLRTLVGLIRPDAGSALFGGVPYARLADPPRTVGAVLDSMGAHPAMTALDHLRTYATLVGQPRSRVSEVIELLDIGSFAHRQTRGFSTGMRQRLRLATALLGDPRVLLLDEPSNGMDPEGISWLRSFLRALAAEGRTILVSSHVLSEVQQSVDDVVLVRHGRLLAAGPLETFVSGDRSLEQAYLDLVEGAGAIA